MTESPVPQGSTTTLPPQSVNGSSPQPPAAAAPPKSAQPPAAALSPKARRMYSRISGMRTGLIAATAALIVVMIFIIQNADAVTINFLGAHLRLSLAVALFLAAIAGALLMAAAGTARITQLRRVMRLDRRKAPAS